MIETGMRIDEKTQRQIVIELTFCYLTSDATIIDIMEWMINTQLGRRNLPPAQRLAVVEKFKKKIQEEAKEKYDETVGRPSKENRSPNGEQLNSKIHTDKELAKLAGVGTGTVARYDAVMKSNDEELWQTQE